MERVPDYDVVWDDVYGDMQDVGPVHRHMRRLVGRLVAGIEYRSVAEVGCGAGHNLEVLTEGRRAPDITGFDISERALEMARERWPDGDFHRLDIEQDAPSDTWDLVYCSLVLEHLPHDEVALQHMRAMTSGHLLLTTIAGNFERYRPWDEQMGHVRNYAVGELEAKLEGAGFSVVEAVYWGWPFYTPVQRTLQNRMTSEPSYGAATRLLAAFLHLLFFLNSSRRGDLLIVLAR